jgi:hypothetical protein
VKIRGHINGHGFESLGFTVGDPVDYVSTPCVAD